MATTVIDESAAESLVASRLNSLISGEADLQMRLWGEEAAEDDSKAQIKLGVSHFAYTAPPGRGTDQATMTLVVLVVSGDRVQRTYGAYHAGTVVSRLRRAVFSGLMVDATTGHEVKAVGFRTREDVDESRGDRTRVKVVDVEYLVTRSAGSSTAGQTPGVGD